MGNKNLNALRDATAFKAERIFENRIPCEWLSTEEAAQYLSMSENALRICAHRNQIPVHHFGRRLRFKLSDLRSALAKKGA